MPKAVSSMYVALLFLAGCAAETPTSWNELNTVNGETPPGELAPLQDTEVWIDTVDADGKRLVVMRGIRMPGTRVGIHVHEYGGHTCVLSGTITDFVEGKEPQVFPAGSCYYMPPNTPMSAANLGEEPAILLDTFNLPPDAPMITVLEPGWSEVVGD